MLLSAINESADSITFLLKLFVQNTCILENPFDEILDDFNDYVNNQCEIRIFTY